MEAASVVRRNYAGFLFGVAVVTGLYLASLYSYLLFHSLAELFSVVVAAGIFMIAWNSRGLYQNNYLQFISIAYLFVAALDLVHTLAYKGMGVFPEYGSNLPTQLWIGTKFIQAISLVIAPFLFNRKLKTGFIFFAFALATSLLLASIFYWNIFPKCFDEQTGLTTFKKTSEYIISILLIISAILLIRKKGEFDPEVLKLLVTSIILTVLSELFFTFYIHVYGLSNLIGHFLAIAAFYLIYKGLIKIGLEEPTKVLFRNLKLSEEKLRQARGDLEIRVEERTAELKKMNEELGLEIEKRKEMEENLRDVSNRLLKAQEAERRSLALDLHDSIGGSLLGIKMALEQKIDAIQQEKAFADSITLEEILDLVKTSMIETGRIQHNLRPSLLDHLGLNAALRSLCREFDNTHRDIKTECTLEVKEKDVPEDLKIIVYRISQEALNNVAKHSGAEHVSLSLIQENDEIRLTILDDGCGFDTQEAIERGRNNQRMGLASMGERCELSRGSFSIDSRKNGGTRIRASWLRETCECSMRYAESD
ncbi:MAG: hypothetical protein HY788_00670 [Deltaproteobacteria bacterium]|nr:hypothetical protein [Deltaproteobacteria bacterium]